VATHFNIVLTFSAKFYLSYRILKRPFIHQSSLQFCSFICQIASARR